MTGNVALTLVLSFAFVFGIVALALWLFRRSLPTRSSPLTLLSAARHVVALFVGSLLASAAFRRSWDFLDWVGTFLIAAACGGVVAVLGALFFTKSQAKQSLQNFVVFAWVSVGLVIAGQYYSQRAPQTTTAALQDEIQLPPASNAVASAKVAEPEKGPIAQPNAWLEKVRLLEQLAAAGAIPVIAGTIQVVGSPQSSSEWKSHDVHVLEVGQTWWVAEGFVYVHLMNRSDYQLSAVEFNYSVGKCKTFGGTVRLVSLILGSAVPSGGNAIVKAHSANIIQPTDGCLTARRAWALNS